VVKEETLPVAVTEESGAVAVEKIAVVSDDEKKTSLKRKRRKGGQKVDQGKEGLVTGSLAAETPVVKEETLPVAVTEESGAVAVETIAVVSDDENKTSLDVKNSLGLSGGVTESGVEQQKQPVTTTADAGEDIDAVVKELIQEAMDAASTVVTNDAVAGGESGASGVGAAVKEKAKKVKLGDGLFAVDKIIMDKVELEELDEIAVATQKVVTQSSEDRVSDVKVDREPQELEEVDEIAVATQKVVTQSSEDRVSDVKVDREPQEEGREGKTTSETKTGLTDVKSVSKLEEEVGAASDGTPAAKSKEGEQTVTMVDSGETEHSASASTKEVVKTEPAMNEIVATEQPGLVTSTTEEDGVRSEKQKVGAVKEEVTAAKTVPVMNPDMKKTAETEPVMKSKEEKKVEEKTQVEPVATKGSWKKHKRRGDSPDAFPLKTKVESDTLAAKAKAVSDDVVVKEIEAVRKESEEKLLLSRKQQKGEKKAEADGGGVVVTKRVEGSDPSTTVLSIKEQKNELDQVTMAAEKVFDGRKRNAAPPLPEIVDDTVLLGEPIGDEPEPSKNGRTVSGLPSDRSERPLSKFQEERGVWVPDDLLDDPTETEEGSDSSVKSLIEITKVSPDTVSVVAKEVVATIEGKNFLKESLKCRLVTTDFVKYFGKVKYVSQSRVICKVPYRISVPDSARIELWDGTIQRWVGAADKDKGSVVFKDTCYDDYIDNCTGCVTHGCGYCAYDGHCYTPAIGGVLPSENQCNVELWTKPRDKCIPYRDAMDFIDLEEPSPIRLITVDAIFWIFGVLAFVMFVVARRARARKSRSKSLELNIPSQVASPRGHHQLFDRSSPAETFASEYMVVGNGNINGVESGDTKKDDDELFQPVQTKSEVRTPRQKPRRIAIRSDSNPAGSDRWQASSNQRSPLESPRDMFSDPLPPFITRTVSGEYGSVSTPRNNPIDDVATNNNSVPHSPVQIDLAAAARLAVDRRMYSYGNLSSLNPSS